MKSFQWLIQPYILPCPPFSLSPSLQLLLPLIILHVYTLYIPNELLDISQKHTHILPQGLCTRSLCLEYLSHRYLLLYFLQVFIQMSPPTGFSTHLFKITTHLPPSLLYFLPSNKRYPTFNFFLIYYPSLKFLWKQPLPFL